MTETLDSTAPAAEKSGAAKKRGGGLNSMLLADLKVMAGGMGIAGAGSMKKAQLIDAIKAAQSAPRGGDIGGAGDAGDGERRDRREPEAGGETGKAAKADQVEKAATRVTADQDAVPKGQVAPQEQVVAEKQVAEQPAGAEDPERSERQQKKADQPDQRGGQGRQGGQNKQGGQQKQGGQNKQDGQQKQGGQNKQDAQQKQDGQNKQDAQQKQGGQNKQDQNRQDRQEQARQERQDRQDRQDQDRHDQDRQDQNRQDRLDQDDQDADGEGGSRRNRRRRGRDRDRTARGTREPDTEVREDDVLVPAAGILDVLDNYAFVRTSGYLAGSDDVYLSLSLVRRYGLRRGDAITGQVRQPREGERREKFNPMVRIDTVNGLDPEQAKNRVEFSKLTPLYPTERLRMETTPDNLTGRVIDIASPIGKGQRGLIVSPAKAGKTMILQSIANSITTNNPECHLMVVLVDERPEEVTDFERSVKGEVIASTFDRPASDHTTVAELAIERAKRLVELGHDVVVLLDGITRLGRAYNLSTPASGRILSGGVDSAALYPPKRFFGAARNIENGGSLTILATALIESDSKMDEVIFEEFKGTGNMEIRLRSDFAEKRMFPAIDAVASGSRREELLMGKEELEIVWKLRRVLTNVEGTEGLELLLERLKKSKTNYEFLLQVQRTNPAEGA